MSQHWGLPQCYVSPLLALVPAILKVSEGENHFVLMGPSLAKEGLVFGPKQSDSGASLEVTMHGGSAVVGSGSIPSIGKIESSSMVDKEQLLKKKGFSNHLVATPLSSRKRVMGAI